MHRYLLILMAVWAIALPACGSSGDDPAKVSAAASLKPAFTTLDTDAQFSFAGSDQLAGQIRAGGRPDVFAAANAKLPDSLYADGLVEKPVAFARNELVIAVAASNKAIQSVDDLAGDGVTLAIGANAVPVGDYTLKVLAKLPRPTAAQILKNARSREPDVSGIVGKVSQGAVDAGFVYASDVKASSGRLRAVLLPTSLRPVVVYKAAVVKDAPNPEAAREFVAALTGGAGSRVLRDAGLQPPP